MECILEKEPQSKAGRECDFSRKPPGWYRWPRLTELAGPERMALGSQTEDSTLSLQYRRQLSLIRGMASSDLHF